LIEVQTAAAAIGLKLQVGTASNEREIDAAFASFVQHRVDAVLAGADALFLSRREQLVGLTDRYRLPAIYHLRHLAVAGGLMSYGVDITDAFRMAGVYAGRILNGEKPHDLPVQQTVKFQLVINLKTARTFGVTVPDKLLVGADEVIE
jgi:putative ABC transport system substrate-binding protein